MDSNEDLTLKNTAKVKEVCDHWPGSEQTHLSLGRGDGGPAGVDLLVDGGEEVLGDTQGILQQREVRVVLGSVLQQVLKHTHTHMHTGAV